MHHSFNMTILLIGLLLCLTQTTSKEYPAVYTPTEQNDHGVLGMNLNVQISQLPDPPAGQTHKVILLEGAASCDTNKATDKVKLASGPGDITYVQKPRSFSFPGWMFGFHRPIRMFGLGSTVDKSKGRLNFVKDIESFVGVFTPCMCIGTPTNPCSTNLALYTNPLNPPNVKVTPKPPVQTRQYPTQYAITEKDVGGAKYTNLNMIVSNLDVAPPGQYHQVIFLEGAVSCDAIRGTEKVIYTLGQTYVTYDASSSNWLQNFLFNVDNDKTKGTVNIYGKPSSLKGIYTPCMCRAMTYNVCSNQIAQYTHKLSPPTVTIH